MAVVWNIPFACDRASADFIISSPLMDKPYDRLIPDYDVYRHRKVPGVEAPALPIPGVTEPKKRRTPDPIVSLPPVIKVAGAAPTEATLP